MKLNEDCIREVLLIAERDLTATNVTGIIAFDKLPLKHFSEEISQYHEEDICYTIIKLEEAGYINASITYADGGVYTCFVNSLTYDGHEFLNKIRDPKQWSMIKAGLSAVRNYSLSAINAVADGVTSAAIHSFIGTL